MFDVKQLLQKLGDELGHITLIADWIEREKVNLAKGDVFAAPVLTGSGALRQLAEPEVPTAGEAPADGNTAPPATSAPSEVPAAPVQDAA